MFFDLKRRGRKRGAKCLGVRVPAGRGCPRGSVRMEVTLEEKDCLALRLERRDGDS